MLLTRFTVFKLEDKITGKSHIHFQFMDHTSDPDDVILSFSHFHSAPIKY